MLAFGEFLWLNYRQHIVGSAPRNMYSRVPCIPLCQVCYLVVYLSSLEYFMIGNGSTTIQLAQCWFPGLAISMLKYKCIFQIKYMEAILSNSSTRKLLWFEIANMLMAV